MGFQDKRVLENWVLCHMGPSHLRAGPGSPICMQVNRAASPAAPVVGHGAQNASPAANAVRRPITGGLEYFLQ